MELKFEKLNTKNYNQVLKIKHLLFPESNSDVDYERYFNGEKNSEDFLVKLNNNPVGITGWYEFDCDNAFMGWFGVLPEYRNKGIGSTITNWTIDLVSKLQYKYFRVYTDIVVNRDSCKLYNKFFDVCEKYTADDNLGKTNQFVIYTKWLSADKNLWNNTLLNEDDLYDI